MVQASQAYQVSVQHSTSHKQNKHSSKAHRECVQGEAISKDQNHASIFSGHNSLKQKLTEEI